ncbi:glycoside hydrolase family 128 protein, partial [Patellaria atrata CBS 101060]
SSSKRGLIHIPNSAHSDSSIWRDAASSGHLTWYYNYDPVPSPSLLSTPLNFVPMLWGDDSSLDFPLTVRSLLSSGTNVTHVLGFNEPDGDHETGGSAISPARAAELWREQIEPLREMGIRAGSPATRGNGGGLAWLGQFFEACEGCEADFIAVHFYGDFEGLASFVGQVRERWRGKDVWVTEYNLPHEDLEPTQEFYNTSSEWFDRLEFVERYSLFGSFRSSVSNVGPNCAMLDQDGELTDIGSWYLGGSFTGNVPKGAASTSA